MSSTKPLDESVSDLRAQVRALGADDDHAGHLARLVNDIEKRLGSSDDPGAHADLGERLTASILQFEGSHSRIAFVLTELAEKLGEMGI